MTPAKQAPTLAHCHPAEPFLEKYRSDEHGKQRIHIIRKARFEYSAHRDREDIHSPVYRDEYAAQEKHTPLGLVLYDPSNLAAMPFYEYNGKAEHAGENYSLRENIG